MPLLGRVFTGIVLAFSVAAPAALGANADYDRPNGFTFSDVPYALSQPLQMTATYDTSAFTETEEYITDDEAKRSAGCGAWGSRTAWVRFATAVPGRLAVSVLSDAKPYDVMFRVSTTPGNVSPSTVQMSNFSDVDCISERHGVPNEAYSFMGGYPIPADRVVYVQTLSVCADRTELPPCTAQERAAAIGGPTTLTLTFKADSDQDGDGVADPADVCADQDGIIGGQPSNGCPDDDHDGVTDRDDRCVGIPGKDGTGCRRRDEDEDGAVDDRLPGGTDCDDDNAAVNPGATETKATSFDDDCDGKLVPDEDDDGFDDSVYAEDCHPDRKDLHAGVKEVVGNKVDENCDRVMAPFPRVTSGIRPRSLEPQGSGTWVGFAAVIVSRIAPGTKVRVTCGCAFVEAIYTVAKAVRSKTFAKQLEQLGALDKGTTLTVHVWRKDAIGIARRYKLDGRGPASKTTFCSLPTSRSKLRRTCPGRL